MGKLKWGQYELLRPAQIDVIRLKRPIAYLPWGALEWHSYHNPIGLDGMKSHGLCKAMAQQTGGVVLPPVYVGTDTIKPLKGFQHTFEHSKDVVRRLCTEYLEQLSDEGFKVLILVMGHYGSEHVKAIKESADAFSAQHLETSVWAFPDSEPLQGRYPANHAARGETSFQLLFFPELVDLYLLPKDRDATLDEDGVWGEDPRKATAQEGAAMLKLFLEHAVPKINKLLARHIP
ncbi:MAG: creatininase family protein [Bacteroidota bacterium]